MALQTELLMARTRAVEEHRRLIELIEKRDAVDAAKLMSHHIMSAMADIFADAPQNQPHPI
jgi:DNA-binding GntR family transcriptional regulator